MLKQDIEQAVEILRNGGLVAVPTETVYGIAADATNGEAVAHIFEVKGRPHFNPLICHISSIAMAEKLVNISPQAAALMQKFWPGPLTFVLPKKNNSPVSGLVSAGLDTLAIRMPDHKATQTIIEELDRPIAAPSANLSGKISPTTAAHVTSGLGNTIDMVINGGDCKEGIESTIITFNNDQVIILRPGTITKAMLIEAYGPNVSEFKASSDGKITAPGQLASHYAPEASLRLNVTEPRDGEYLIGFGDIKGDISLSETGNLRQAASNLFKHLITADTLTSGSIAVAPIPADGIGLAINDRLKRAAAPRDK